MCNEAIILIGASLNLPCVGVFLSDAFGVYCTIVVNVEAFNLMMAVVSVYIWEANASA